MWGHRFYKRPPHGGFSYARTGGKGAEMSEDQKPQEAIEPEQPQGSQSKPQGEPKADETDWKAEARKWEKRAKEHKSNAEALKVKADAYDELKEAEKTELQKANERAEKAEAELKAANERAKALEDERERAKAVMEAAAAHGVDADVLARMEGDVEENAKLLESKGAKMPPYPQVKDNGETQVPHMTREEALEKINKEKDPVKRVRMRAELISSSD